MEKVKITLTPEQIREIISNYFYNYYAMGIDTFVFETTECVTDVVSLSFMAELRGRE